MLRDAVDQLLAQAEIQANRESCSFDGQWVRIPKGGYEGKLRNGRRAVEVAERVGRCVAPALVLEVLANDAQSGRYPNFTVCERPTILERRVYGRVAKIVVERTTATTQGHFASDYPGDTTTTPTTNEGGGVGALAT
jgi:hypothetical protein